MTHISLLHVLNLDTIGGVESLYVHFLKQALQSQGKEIAHNFTVVSGKKIHPLYMNHMTDLGLKKPFHEQYVLGLRLPKLLRFITEIRRGMIESIFHGMCRWVFWNRIEENAPPEECVYYEHGASWLVSPTPKKERFVREAKKVIANSKAAKILLSHLWGLPLQEITIVENPLRPDIEILAEPKKLSISQGPIRLGYIGRLIALKSPSVCLYTLKDLLDRNIDATLDIAGEGPEKVFLQNLAIRLGISERVRFLGTVSTIHTFYDNIDILIIPSVREPLGLVALEASARGIPVVASCVDGLYESVLHNGSGILIPPSLDFGAHEKEFISKKHGLPSVVVDPVSETITTPKFLDPSTVSHTIQKLMSDPEEYLRLSTGGLFHVRNRITFDDYYTKLLQEFVTPPLETADEEEQEA